MPGGPLNRTSPKVVRRERLLLDPVVRASPQRVLALLHPAFVEFGASGRRWDADDIAEALHHDPGDRPVEPTRLTADRPAHDVVLLTYETHRDGQEVLRSSVCVRGPRE